MQETHCGGDGVGKSMNNVCGITSGGSFVSYLTLEDGFNACVEVVKKYQPWTIYQMSRKWTTTQQDEWFRNVTYFYEQS